MMEGEIATANPTSCDIDHCPTSLKGRRLEADLMRMNGHNSPEPEGNDSDKLENNSAKVGHCEYADQVIVLLLGV